MFRPYLNPLFISTVVVVAVAAQRIQAHAQSSNQPEKYRVLSLILVTIESLFMLLMSDLNSHLNFQLGTFQVCLTILCGVMSLPLFV